MKVFKYILLYFLVICLNSCKEIDYEMKATPAEKVTNFKAENLDGDIALSWQLPASEDPLTVIVLYNGEEKAELLNSATTYTIVNPEVNKEHVYTVKVKTSDGRMSEGVTTRISLNGTNAVTNLKGEREDGNIKLTWDIPTSNSGSEIEISYADQTVRIPSSETSYIIPNTPTSVKYTIGVRTIGSNTKSHIVYAEVNSLQFGMIITYNSVSEIEDDDELAAATWFVNTYTDGIIIPVSSIKNNTIDLSNFGVLWIQIDRIGTGALPASLLDNDVVTAVSNYYKNGGSLLLTNHATQYISELGRTTRKPGIIGAGNGGSGTDHWTFNFNLGMTYDQGNHDLYKGLNKDPQYFGHPTIALIGPGQREDHNSMWDLNSYPYTIAGDNVVDKFQKENNAVVLATWGHVTDFCCAGIIEFSPNSNYKGKAIAIGLAAYEWNQNSGVNVHQEAIEKLTENSFNYLAK